MKYFNTANNYAATTGGDQPSNTNNNMYQTSVSKQPPISVVITPTLRSTQKPTSNNHQKVVLAEGGISQITSSIIKGYMSDKIAKTTGKGADLATISGQTQKASTNTGAAAVPISITSLGQQSKYRSPQQQSLGLMGSGGDTKKVKVSKMHRAVPSQGMLIKQGQYDPNVPLRQPQTLNTKQVIHSKKVSERTSPSQQNEQFSKGSLVTQSKLGMHRHKRSDGDAQNLTKITMMHLRSKIQPPPATIFPSTTISNNENRNPSTGLDDSLCENNANPYLPLTLNVEKNRPPSSKKFNRHSTVMGSRPTGTQQIAQPGNPAPALLEADLNVGYKLPARIQGGERSESKQQILKEDQSLDSLHTFTSLGNNNHNQEKVQLTKSLIETSSIMNQLEITPKVTHVVPPLSRLTENKQLDVIHERRGESMPMRLDHILASIKLDQKITDQDITQIFATGPNSQQSSRIKTQNIYKTSQSKKYLGQDSEMPSPPVPHKYNSGGPVTGSVGESFKKPPLQLLSKEYVSYLESYEASLISHFQQNDQLVEERFNRGYIMHEEISEALRARLIDWILHCTQVCEMDDRNIFFMVVRIVDFFYCNVQEEPQPKNELQLTAIAAIFMASKLLQINHINLKFCYENIGHTKFTYKQIAERESQIMVLYDWEISTQNTIYETFELLMMMIRRRCNMRITEEQTQSFLSSVMSLALQIIRGHMCAYAAIKKKSIDVASACLQIALAYHTHEFSRLKKPHSSISLQSSPEINHRKTTMQSQQQSNAVLQAEILLVIESWRDICERYLGRSMQRVQPHTIEVLQNVLRIRDLLSLNTENHQGQHQSRIKEIMVFSDHFIQWAQKYNKEQQPSSNTINNGVSATIMMFSTDEDEEYEDDEQMQPQKLY